MSDHKAPGSGKKDKFRPVSPAIKTATPSPTKTTTNDNKNNQLSKTRSLLDVDEQISQKGQANGTAKGHTTSPTTNDNKNNKPTVSRSPPNNHSTGKNNTAASHSQPHQREQTHHQQQNKSDHKRHETSNGPSPNGANHNNSNQNDFDDVVLSDPGSLGSDPERYRRAINLTAIPRLNYAIKANVEADHKTPQQIPTKPAKREAPYKAMYSFRVLKDNFRKADWSYIYSTVMGIGNLIIISVCICCIIPSIAVQKCYGKQVSQFANEVTKWLPFLTRYCLTTR